MIPSNLRVVLIIGVITYFIIILMFLKKKALSLKYTLLWLLAGVVLGVMVFWPELLIRFIHYLYSIFNYDINVYYLHCIQTG